MNQFDMNSRYLILYLIYIIFYIQLPGYMKNIDFIDF